MNAISTLKLTHILECGGGAVPVAALTVLLSSSHPEHSQMGPRCFVHQWQMTNVKWQMVNALLPPSMLHLPQQQMLQKVVVPCEACNRQSCHAVAKAALQHEAANETDGRGCGNA